MKKRFTYFDTLALEQQGTKFLVLLISTDLVFGLLNIYRKIIGETHQSLLSITREGGYAESYQYIKELWIVVLLLMLAGRTKKTIYFNWSLLFLYFLLDDSLQLHERAGRMIENLSFFPAWFGYAHLGELVFVSFMGLLLFVVIGLSYRKSDEASKTMTKSLLLFVAGLSFFGVFVDGLHTLLSKMGSIPGADYISGFIEDGGEMVMMSFIAWHVFRIKAEDGS